MEITLFKLGAIAVMLVLVWLLTRNLHIKVPVERRNTDFYRIYNDLEDRDETLFDRRRREDFEDRTETLFTTRVK